MMFRSRDISAPRSFTNYLGEIVTIRYDDVELTNAILNSNIDYIKDYLQDNNQNKICDSITYIKSQNILNNNNNIISPEMVEYLLNINNDCIVTSLIKYFVDSDNDNIDISLIKYMLTYVTNTDETLSNIILNYVDVCSIYYKNFSKVQQYKDLLLYTINIFQDRITLKYVSDKSFSISISKVYTSRYIWYDVINYILFKIFTNNIINKTNINLKTSKLIFLVEEIIKYNAPDTVVNFIMEILEQRNVDSKVFEDIRNIDVVDKPDHYISLFNEDI